jgi:hypothetical protein
MLLLASFSNLVGYFHAATDEEIVRGQLKVEATSSFFPSNMHDDPERFPRRKRASF